MWIIAEKAKIALHSGLQYSGAWNWGNSYLVLRGWLQPSRQLPLGIFSHEFSISRITIDFCATVLCICFSFFSKWLSGRGWEMIYFHWLQLFRLKVGHALMCEWSLHTIYLIKLQSVAWETRGFCREGGEQHWIRISIKTGNVKCTPRSPRTVSLWGMLIWVVKFWQPIWCRY